MKKESRRGEGKEDEKKIGVEGRKVEEKGRIEEKEEYREEICYRSNLNSGLTFLT